jgi:hypothetical protein
MPGPCNSSRSTVYLNESSGLNKMAKFVPRNPVMRDTAGLRGVHKECCVRNDPWGPEEVGMEEDERNRSEEARNGGQLLCPFPRNDCVSIKVGLGAQSMFERH